MKKITTLLSLAIVAFMMMAMLGGCVRDKDLSGGSSGSGSTSKTEPNVDVELPVNEKVSGTVTYAVRDNVIDETKIWLKDFKKMYPNIEVQLKEFTDDLEGMLTTNSASNTLPDVVLGWDNLSGFAANNWLYPLDEFLDKDPEKEYIHKISLDGFKYLNKTYAVPAWLQFSAVVLNLDLCETLNMDIPDYNWTIDEFTDMLKKATTSEYSGINHVGSLEQYLMMQYQKEGHQWGYNPATNSFNITNGAFTNAVKYTNDLLKINQLVADGMRDEEKIKANQMDDYSQKFGANTDGLAEGKILVANQSTWDDSWMNVSFEKFKWDYYPVPAPTKEDSKQIVHADYAVMLSSAKNPEAAYELLKFISFGKHGLTVRMNLQKLRNEQNPTNNRFTIPPSSAPEVSELFNKFDNIPNGIKYMYNNMNNAVKGDYSKILPDYWKTVNDNLWQAKDNISKGQDPAAVSRAMEEKINSEYKASYDAFKKSMEKVQKEFEENKGK